MIGPVDVFALGRRLVRWFFRCGRVARASAWAEVRLQQRAHPPVVGLLGVEGVEVAQWAAEQPLVAR
ncbi:hypothetical protein ETD86_36845 [Nonomuraea turkmeniaca]|uniref:Uncharacterized protein n=1 Tax=Nonomuraea turkmeniaca TaxID=103838 RepID=A0A5S4F5E8_9ACTN|nr:hypothetical protein [Nonomuraea turkmeniaca]TMR11133.1 hypothetical protein ETD86_36845 [Nonomuraea turkmeniaca]